jgi:hypothetical protein
VLLERERKPAEARAAYEQAVAKGSTSFYTYYRLASLMWTSSASTPDLEKAEELAAKSTSLNDGYAWSQAYLASLRLRLGKAGGAVSPAMRAMAKSALPVSKSDEDRQRVQLAIDRYSK